MFGFFGSIVLVSLTTFLPHEVLDSARLEQVTRGEGASRYPTWDPSGSKIAFESDRDGNWNLYVRDLRAGRTERLTTSTKKDRYPAWSPDGKRVLFLSDRGGGNDLHCVEIASGKVERVASIPGDEMFPAWSPNGSEIVFTLRVGEDHELMRLPWGRMVPEPFVWGRGRNLWPRWSGDGTHLVFFSRRGPHREDDELYLCRPETGALVRLTDRKGHDFCPSFHPGGRILVSVGINRDGSRALRLLDLEGREVARIALAFHRVTEPSWSPDGKRIAFAGIREEGRSYQVFVEPIKAKSIEQDPQRSIR